MLNVETWCEPNGEAGHEPKAAEAVAAKPEVAQGKPKSKAKAGYEHCEKCGVAVEPDDVDSSYWWTAGLSDEEEPDYQCADGQRHSVFRPVR